MIPLKNSEWTTSSETWSIFFIETWIGIDTHKPYHRFFRSTHGFSQAKAHVHFVVLQLEPYKLLLYKWPCQKQWTKTETEISHWINDMSEMKYCQDTMLQKGNSPWSWCGPTEPEKTPWSKSSAESITSKIYAQNQSHRLLNLSTKWERKTNQEPFVDQWDALAFPGFIDVLKEKGVATVRLQSVSILEDVCKD